ncbi:hypothetical protein D9757_003629 [Collybiopsis confluens]|uniref:WD40 repeat-like protein n=1 Tax=Collybiopsis confluens TaxID=2823264 RepID=A0A8H5HUS9_9AGAR|nr:hypothetical protein D9757_003629 [Collybiopsis confluens]
MYSTSRILNTPAPVSALEFPHAGHLFVGSYDGTLRLYDLSSFKVIRAVRGLKDEISSIASTKRPGTNLRDVWVACGNSVHLFKMDTPSMILNPQDTIASTNLTQYDADVVNDIALDIKHLAFSTDGGTVGIVDLSTNSIWRMKEGHTSISSCVNFVPDRPRELISAGYDEAFLHFDFQEGTILSQHKIQSPSPTVSDGISLSPPFIMSTAMSSNGILAAGTADGRLWAGLGGQKGLVSKSKSKAKRSRKWNGLSDEDGILCTKVADGPIVALSFVNSKILCASTLLGTIIQWKINVKSNDQDTILEEVWRKNVTGMDKVNALVTNDTKIIVGGLTKEGKGVIEIWDIPPQNTASA